MPQHLDDWRMTYGCVHPAARTAAPPGVRRNYPPVTTTLGLVLRLVLRHQRDFQLHVGSKSQDAFDSTEVAWEQSTGNRW